VLRVSTDEQTWQEYARSLLVFSAAGWLALYLVIRTQAIQPFNPQGFTHSAPWDVSFNTASSFVINTSWQYYAGETTLSDFAQLAGITVASFTSMATGMAVAAAVIRGFARSSCRCWCWSWQHCRDGSGGLAVDDRPRPARARRVGVCLPESGAEQRISDGSAIQASSSRWPATSAPMGSPSPIWRVAW
jgi:hypothetical protein